MANEEQLSILKQGVEVWNRWREENPNTPVNLSFAELHGANLMDANLSEADLSGADLREADLNSADLGEAKLIKANLSGATLRDTNLYEADLSEANFTYADLRYASLGEAILTGAILVEVNLAEADLEGADLKQTDLSGADLRSAFLSGADLSGANLRKADLSKDNSEDLPVHATDLKGANLTGADLSDAILSGADLSQANLSGANLCEANLIEANLTLSNLSEANLMRANLNSASLSGANLRGADLSGAYLIGTNLVGAKIDKAKISGSMIYAVNVWDLVGEFEEQKDLIITQPLTPVITVDNIKVAQFIYLILNNEEIRDVINTLTSKAVLILGRFAIPERKAILDALRDKLREYNLLPIVFDFDRPPDKDFTETIKTLAGLSYFVIADITNPKSSPLELQATVPDYQIPFVPIIQEGESPFAMMVDLQKKYNWVLDTLTYNSIETLIKALKPAIIDPAIQKHNELRLIKAREPKIRSANDFIDDKGIE